MKTPGLVVLALTFAVLVSVPRPILAAPPGTAFTYQGRLDDAGQPANGRFDLRFEVYDAETGGTAVGSAVTAGNVAVNDGVFTVPLDFGAGVFDGTPRWLQIAVRPATHAGRRTVRPMGFGSTNGLKIVDRGQGRRT